MLKSNSQQPVGREECTLVGVASTFEGIDSLRHLLKRLQRGYGLCCIVMLQRPDSQPDPIVAELVHLTDFTVEVVDGKKCPRADTLFISLPQAGVTVRDGVLFPCHGQSAGGANYYIDQLFRSLADDQGSWSVGVVLAGIGNDGARGALAIKEEGGFVFVQQLDSARYSSMPRAVIDSDASDLVLTPEAIADQLRATSRLSPTRWTSTITKQSSQLLKKLNEPFYQRTGLQLLHYRENTVMRQLYRRIAQLELLDDNRYLSYVQLHPEELDYLAQGICTYAASPERISECQGALVDTLSLLLELDRPWEGEPLRLWVAGCGSGEEVYYLLAMMQQLAKPLLLQRERVVVFATDVNEEALQQAQSGLTEAMLEALPLEDHLKSLCFVKRGLRWRLVDSLRQCVTFARHNVLQDPPFLKLDFIFCRHVLNYFSQEQQRRALHTFHYALARGGRLLLGREERPESEGLFEASERFNQLLIPCDGTLPLAHPLWSRVKQRSVGAKERGEGNTKDNMVALHQPALSSLDHAIEQALRQQLLPPSITVDENGRCIYFSGDLSPFVALPSGIMSYGFREFIRAELREEAALLYEKCRRLRQPYRSLPRQQLLRGTPHWVVIGVTPVAIELSGTPRSLVVISFHSLSQRCCGEAPMGWGKSGGGDSADGASVEVSLAALAGGQPLESQHQLEQELMQARIDHLTITQDLHRANESLRIANADLQTMVEDLRRSQGEMHAVNEEMAVLNELLVRGNDDLKLLNSDLTSVLNSIASPVIVVDGTFHILRANASARELLALTEGDIPISVGNLRLDEAQQATLLALIHRSLQRGSLQEEVFFGGRDYRLESYLQGSEGRWERLVLVFVDMTEPNRIRSLLGSLINATSVAIARVDGQHHISYANRPFGQLFGIDTERQWWDSATPIALEQLLPVDLLAHLAEHFDAARSGRPVLLPEVYLVAKSGQPRYFQIVLTPEEENPQESTAYYFTCVDITESKQMYLRQRELAQLESLGRLTAGIAHDFNNHLAVIGGNIELCMLDCPEGSPQLPLLDEALNAIASSSALIQSLLAYACQKPQKRQTLPIDRFLLRLRSTAERIAPKSVVLTFSCEEQPLFVEVDPTQLESAMMNLIINAVKAMPEGGNLRISIKGHHQEHAALDTEGLLEPSSYALICVQDEGVGMSPEVLARCREPFYTTRRSGEGTGLGLSTVQGFVAQAGGTMRIQSQLGEGTTICLYLPLATPPKGQAIEHQGSSSPPPEALQPGDGQLILVVEDRTSLRQILQQMLERLGYRVHVEENGEAAIAYLLQAPDVDLVLCDVVMPGIVSGFDVRDWLRDARPELPIVLASGYNSEELQDHGIVGETPLLRKPYAIKELSALLWKMLHPAVSVLS